MDAVLTFTYRVRWMRHNRWCLWLQFVNCDMLCNCIIFTSLHPSLSMYLRELISSFPSEGFCVTREWWKPYCNAHAWKLKGNKWREKFSSIFLTCNLINKLDNSSSYVINPHLVSASSRLFILTTDTLYISKCEQVIFLL